MTLYQKVLSVFGLIRSSIDQKAAIGDLAPEFDETASYAVDRLVIYDKRLYRCVAAHTGSWNAADFARTTLDEVLATKSSGGTPYVDALYLKDEASGKFHKVVIDTAGGISTIGVDQNGVSA